MFLEQNRQYNVIIKIYLAVTSIIVFKFKQKVDQIKNSFKSIEFVIFYDDPVRKKFSSRNYNYEYFTWPFYFNYMNDDIDKQDTKNKSDKTLYQKSQRSQTNLIESVSPSALSINENLQLQQIQQNRSSQQIKRRKFQDNNKNIQNNHLISQSQQTKYLSNDYHLLLTINLSLVGFSQHFEAIKSQCIFFLIPTLLVIAQVLSFGLLSKQNYIHTIYVHILEILRARDNLQIIQLQWVTIQELQRMHVWDPWIIIGKLRQFLSKYESILKEHIPIYLRYFKLIVRKSQLFPHPAESLEKINALLRAIQNNDRSNKK